MSSEEDLRARVDELERKLDELRAERGDGRRPRRRPPSPREFLRFTESHAIPTAVATLEAAIQSLELLRGLLRLLDPEASDQRRLADVPAGVESATRRTLSEVRAALDATATPDDPEARKLLADVRELVVDVESRIDAAGRDAPRGSGTGVRIDVRDEGDADGGGASVDVEAELESIRAELRDAEDDGDEDGVDEDGVDEDERGE